MHSEDYVHRIGRTGRAHAIGDAISFITPEDQGPLRSLERFIGRGIVRKKAEGFDYNQAAPPRDEESRGARGPQRKIEPRLHGNSWRGNGDAPHGQIGWRFRNASSNNRTPRRSYRRHRRFIKELVTINPILRESEPDWQLVTASRIHRRGRS